MKRPGRKPKRHAVTVAPVAMIEVDNPHYNPSHESDKTNPRRIMAAINPKESYTTWLMVRGHIDHCEYRAALRFRDAYEKMGGAGARAIDYSQTPVDGGQVARTVTDVHLRASKLLREASATLGSQGYNLVMRLAAEGHWPASLTKNEANRKYIGYRYRECLDALAVRWGFKTRPMRRWTA